MKNVICRNCEEPAEGHFCSNCGQSTSVGKVNIHTIVHEFLHGIVHVDKGIVYTVKELTLNPGKTIRDYFYGKRVKLFKPFAYLFLITSVYVFLYHLAGQSLVNVKVEATVDVAEEVTRQIDQKVSVLIGILEKNSSLISFCAIPFISLLTMLFFRIPKYNYGEHLIMNSYLYGHQMIISILTLPLNYVLEQKTAVNCTSVLAVVLFVYMIASVFDTYKLWKRILYALLVQGIFLFSIVSLTIIYLIISL